MIPDSRARRRRAAPVTALGALVALLALAAGPTAHAAEACAEPPRLNAWPEGAPTPDFTLADSEGVERTMASYAGHVTVVTFGYANCPAACSLELHKLAAAMRTLGANRNDVRVLFATLDPDRDSPAALARFVHGFDRSFIALRGTPAQTDAATKRFSIENARVAAGDSYLIDHVIEEFVFDRSGRLRLLGSAETTASDLAHDLSGLLGSPEARCTP